MSSAPLPCYRKLPPLHLPRHRYCSGSKYKTNVQSLFMKDISGGRTEPAVAGEITKSGTALVECRVVQWSNFATNCGSNNERVP